MKLEQLLKELGWSQAELGRRIGVHKNTISNWCSSNKPPEVVIFYLEMKLQLRKLGE